ncbi:MAG: hypothetical protein AABW90_02885 [Nanoarchaeota archaeon]
MKYKPLFYGILATGGLTVGISFGLMSGPFTRQPKTSAPTHVYTASLDDSEPKEKYDDLVVRKASGDIEFYLKDVEGNFTNIEGLKKKELSDLVNWRNEELKQIKKNFDGIRSRLNSN